MERVLAVSLTLIFISAFIVVLIGNSLLNVNADIKRLGVFMENSESTKGNFEKSLQMYTENTQEVIDFLLSLRPENEEEYIKFLAAIEDIGQKSSLDISIKSIKEEPKKNEGDKTDTLNYSVDFYGTNDDLIGFLKAIEELPYFVGIRSLQFMNPELITEENEDISENIHVEIGLFTKSQ